MGGRNGSGKVGYGALCVQLVTVEDPREPQKWAAWLERWPEVRIEIAAYPLTGGDLEGLRRRLEEMVAAQAAG